LADPGGIVLHILALSRSALIVRHWFEINLDDASMEHGARIELRELAPAAHRGSESTGTPPSQAALARRTTTLSSPATSHLTGSGIPR
jgi:hypothetical protein